MTICSSIVAWKIPRTEEFGGLYSIQSPRVGHDEQTEPTQNQKNEKFSNYFYKHTSKYFKNLIKSMGK